MIMILKDEIIRYSETNMVFLITFSNHTELDLNFMFKKKSFFCIRYVTLLFLKYFIDNELFLENFISSINAMVDLLIYVKLQMCMSDFPYFMANNVVRIPLRHKENCLLYTSPSPRDED